jgi:hypothetical protein
MTKPLDPYVGIADDESGPKRNDYVRQAPAPKANGGPTYLSLAYFPTSHATTTPLSQWEK